MSARPTECGHFEPESPRESCLLEPPNDTTNFCFKTLRPPIVTKAESLENACLDMRDSGKIGPTRQHPRRRPVPTCAGKDDVSSPTAQRRWAAFLGFGLSLLSGFGPSFSGLTLPSQALALPSAGSPLGGWPSPSFSGVGPSFWEFGPSFSAVDPSCSGFGPVGVGQALLEVWPFL